MVDCPNCSHSFEPMTFYTKYDVARALHVTPRAVTHWIYSGQLKTKYIPYFGSYRRIIWWRDLVEFSEQWSRSKEQSTPRLARWIESKERASRLAVAARRAKREARRAASEAQSSEQSAPSSESEDASS